MLISLLRELERLEVDWSIGYYLFGDLSKATKEITDANKLAKRVRAAGS